MALTLNEMRDALGLDPYTNTAADRPMVLTATGYVPIEVGAGGEAAKAETRANGQRASALSRLADTKRSITKDYNPDQPRVPAGNTDGGQWTSAADADDSNTASSDPPKPTIPYQKYGKGHHWVPKEVYENRNFAKETKAVFKGSTSGPLADPSVNFRTQEHIQYTEAVDELLDDFLKKNNITEEEMTPAQAEELVQEVIGSSDPRISGFVMNIKREMWRYIERYGPWLRGGGGDED